ncbi:MAG: DUF459 domain-containing protein [Kiritimatiellia bacterium]
MKTSLLRPFVLLLAGLLSAAAAGAEGGPVLLVGDSLMKEVGRSAKRQLAKTGGEAVVESSIGSGLARLDLFDWPAKLKEKLAAKPAWVVLLIGANDDQDLDSPTGSVAYGTPAWSEVYAQRVDAMLAAAKEAGAKVLWVGLPRMRDARSDAHATLVNGIIKARIAAAGRGEFYDIAPVYAVGNKYSPFILLPPNDQVLQVRGEDGIHFNREGAEHLAGLILGKLK